MLTLQLFDSLGGIGVQDFFCDEELAEYIHNSDEMIWIRAILIPLLAEVRNQQLQLGAGQRVGETITRSLDQAT